jgi:hypothetical protein
MFPNVSDSTTHSPLTVQPYSISLHWTCPGQSICPCQIINVVHKSDSVWSLLVAQTLSALPQWLGVVSYSPPGSVQAGRERTMGCAYVSNTSSKPADLQLCGTAVKTHSTFMLFQSLLAACNLPGYSVTEHSSTFCSKTDTLDIEIGQEKGSIHGLTL